MRPDLEKSEEKEGREVDGQMRRDAKGAVLGRRGRGGEEKRRERRDEAGKAGKQGERGG